VIIQHFASAHTPWKQYWPIRGVLSGVSGIYGGPGTGKSFVAMSMAVSVASGRPWIGRETVEGPVVYVAGEGGRELVARRLRAAVRVWGIDPNPDRDSEEYEPANDEFLPLYIVTPGPDLVAGHEGLKVLIGDRAPKLLIVDTLSRCFIGDENKQEDMGKFVRSLDRLRDSYGSGTAVLVIHHTNAQKKMRGSTVFEGALDVLWKLSQHGGQTASGERCILMTADKLRERDIKGAQMYLRLCPKASRCPQGEQEYDEVGDSLTTLVVKPSRALLKDAEMVQAVGEGLIAASAGGTVRYERWRASVPQRSKAEFDSALSMILTYPGHWGHLEQGPLGVFKKRLG